jgi:hypothetical protein
VTLSSVYNIAASGMDAAFVRQSGAARNSANLLSENAGRLVTTQRELHSGGVRADLERIEEAADPVADAIDRSVAVYSLKANLLSLRTADKMVGTVLNLKA